MPFDINNFQFVTKEGKKTVQVEEGKTLRIVCCPETLEILQGLVPYSPDERDFEFFSHTFSGPHIFRELGNLGQIISRPEFVDGFIKILIEKVQKIDRLDLKEYFFKCVEIDIRLDKYLDQTGKMKLFLLEFLERVQEVKDQFLNEPPTDVLEPENNLMNPDFTTARQVLAMHFLFGYCNVKGIDQTKKADFIQFLTNKSWKNIYDLVRNPLATKTGGFRREDLQFIRPYFENLGLSEIAKMINNELEKPDL